jgi:monoamine oxidase
MRPGALTGAGDALRRPIGPVHLAGTETALEWCGYLEGALESGERAAAEVIASLGLTNGRGEA